MTPRPRIIESPPSQVGEIEGRFSGLLELMRKRYLALGYELDDVHLAEILGVHEGVLRKGKTVSVSPSLALAAGRTWGLDLNWLLLGRGREPLTQGPAQGLERLPLETRVARGLLDSNKVRLRMRSRKLSQQDLASRLGIAYTRAGALVRGQLRDPELRLRLAETLGASVEEFFIVTVPDSSGDEASARETGKSSELFSLSTVRQALGKLLDEQLEPAIRAGQALADSGSAPGGELIRLEVPPPPPELSEHDRRRYEHNREVLERWSETGAAFHVPPGIAERYCREVVGFYGGGRVDDVGGLLRDFIQESAESGGAAKTSGSDQIELRKGVLAVGDTEIEVDDPELLARIPAYLSTRVGRRRLLAWLRENVGRR